MIAVSATALWIAALATGTNAVLKTRAAAAPTAKAARLAARSTAFNKYVQDGRSPLDKPWSVQPHPESAGVERAFQERIAASLESVPFLREALPDHRVEHFSWLTETDLRFVGWNAGILGVAEEGTVALRITPNCDFGGGVVTILDHIIEFYHLAEDGWVFVCAMESPLPAQHAYFVD